MKPGISWGIYVIYITIYLDYGAIYDIICSYLVVIGALFISYGHK